MTERKRVHGSISSFLSHFFSRAVRVYLAYNLTLTAPIWDFFSTWFSNEIARRMGHMINVIPLRYAKELHAL